MERSFYSPCEILELTVKSGVRNANLSLGKTIILGIMAGAFIALGAAASNVAVHNIPDVGLAKTLAGLIFPVGLMLVIFAGCQLFTGNCLMTMAFLDGKIKLSQMLRNWVVVYFSNFAGALMVTALIFFSNQLDFSDGGLGAYAIKIAVNKTNITPFTAIASGILCNVLVCFAIILAAAAKDAVGKIFTIFFPICAFVICGFEHCVANMFYVPIGIAAAANEKYAAVAEKLYGITAQQCSDLTHLAGIDSFLYVTVGNIIGGAILVSLSFYFAQRKSIKQ